MGVIQTAAKWGAAASDPISQMLSVYSTLNRVQRGKEEMSLRERGETRAEGADVRAGEVAELGMKRTQQAIDIAGSEQEYLQGQRQNEADINMLMGIDATIGAQGQLSEKQIEFALGKGLKGVVNAGRGEDAQMVMQANANVAKLVDELGAGVESGQIKGPVSIRRSQQHEQLFQSLERLSVDRSGETHSYQTIDPDTGSVVTAEGTVGQIVNVFFDPQTDSLSVSMSVVDPKTGKPLIGENGTPIVVPATTGRTAEDGDTIKMVPREAMGQVASANVVRQQAAIQSMKGLSPIKQRQLLLSARLEAGDNTAIAELAEVRKSVSHAAAFAAMANDPKVDDLERQEFARNAQLLESGDISAKDAMAMSEKASAGARRKLGKKIKEEDAKRVADTATAMQKQKDVAALERTKYTADKAAERRQDTTKKAEDKALFDARKAAKKAVETAETRAAQEYNKLIRADFGPEVEAHQAAGSEGERAKLRATFVKSYPGVSTAYGHLETAERDMRDAGLLKKPTSAAIPDVPVASHRPAAAPGRPPLSSFTR